MDHSAQKRVPSQNSILRIHCPPGVLLIVTTIPPVLCSDDVLRPAQLLVLQVTRLRLLSHAGEPFHRRRSSGRARVNNRLSCCPVRLAQVHLELSFPPVFRIEYHAASPSSNRRQLNVNFVKTVTGPKQKSKTTMSTDPR